MKSFKLRKEQFGKKWPFSCDKVKVINPKNKELYVISEGKKYNLNGVAINGKPLENIWLKNPEISGARISIGFIFSICKEYGF